MTYSEQIIKAMECCYTDDGSCSGCPFQKEFDACVGLTKNAVGVLNKLVDEVERLRSLCETKDHIINKVSKNTQEIGRVAIRAIADTKAEVVKEMQERLHKVAFVDTVVINGKQMVYVDDIDHIAKEMVEGKK